MTYYRALFGLSLLAFAPPSLLSQNTVTPGQSSLQTQLNMMKLSSRLRLQTAAGRQEGRLILRTADSLVVRGVEGDETHLPLVAIDSMWVSRHRTGLGLLIGTLVGGVAYLVTTSASKEELDIPELDNAFGGALWVSSALVGTLVGGLSSHWKLVHPN